MLDAIAGCNPLANLELVQKAHAYAAFALAGLRLRNGSPALSRSLEVAHTLALLHLDETVIVAGLLYDTALNTEIPDDFGQEAVDIVTKAIKASHAPWMHGEPAHGVQVLAIQRGMCDDMRVFLVMLANRLQTMRSLYCQPPHKQERTAKETMKIFFPLVRCLGLRDIEAEMEELCSLYIRPNAYGHAADGDYMAWDPAPDGIIVYTPKGKAMLLPPGATPVDFAYQIHTERGDHCLGAKVNGWLMPLKAALHNNDAVEIITHAEVRPREEWLEFVQTAKAHKCIRRFLRQEKHRRGPDSDDCPDESQELS